jgi:hypothetical protein
VSRRSRTSARLCVDTTGAAYGGMGKRTNLAQRPARPPSGSQVEFAADPGADAIARGRTCKRTMRGSGEEREEPSSERGTCFSVSAGSLGRTDEFSARWRSL